MGKRTGQLAGLAALGALGYMLSQDKKGERAPVESRVRSSDAPASASVAVEQFTPTPRMVDNGDDRDIGGGFHPAGFRRNMETGEMYDPGTVPNRVATSGAPASAPARVAAPAAPRANLSTPGVSDAYPDESRRGRMTSAPETDDVPGAEAAVARFKKETAGMSPAIAQGRYPMTKRQPITNTYTRAMGAQAGEAEAYRAAQAARSSARGVDQIPTDSALYRNVTGGERVSGNELTRNVGNTLSALAPLGGGFGKVGAELMTAKGAAERAAKARELAEAARRAKPATTMKSSASTAPARANQAAKSGRKKFNEDEAEVVFKRGGATKKMASGGMSVSKASSRADGIAQRGKTRGKLY